MPRGRSQQPLVRREGESNTAFNRRCTMAERSRACRQEQRNSTMNTDSNHQQQQQHSSNHPFHSGGGGGGDESTGSFFGGVSSVNNNQHHSNSNSSTRGRGGGSGIYNQQQHNNSNSSTRGRGGGSGIYNQQHNNSNSSTRGRGGGSGIYNQQQHNNSNSSTRGRGGGGGVSSTPYRPIQAVRPSTIDPQQALGFSSTPYRPIQAVRPSTIDPQQAMGFFEQQNQLALQNSHCVAALAGLDSQPPVPGDYGNLGFDSLSVSQGNGWGAPQYAPHNNHPAVAPHDGWGAPQYSPHNNHPAAAPHDGWGPPQYAPHNNHPAAAPHNGWGPPHPPPPRHIYPADASLADMPHHALGRSHWAGPPHDDLGWLQRSNQWGSQHHHSVQARRHNHPADEEQDGRDSPQHSSQWGSPIHQAHRPRRPTPPSRGHHHQGSVSRRALHRLAPTGIDRNAACFNPDENRPPHSSAVARRPIPGQDDSPPFSLTGQTLHCRHESLDSMVSYDDDSDEEVAHAGSGLTAAPSSTSSVSSAAVAQRHSADPSTPEDETSDGDDNLLDSLPRMHISTHRCRKSNSDIDSAVLSEQQNNKQQNQHPTTHRYATRSATLASAAVPPSEPDSTATSAAAGNAALRARDLPETNCSHFIENYVKQSLSSNYLVVREVARNVKMFERHAFLCDEGSEEGSEKGSYLERTILVFDVLDDGDLIKFALCFQEHGEDSLKENRLSVYIDCIDSVKLRGPGLPIGVTLAAHSPTFRELLFGYLDFARRRGFKEFHLWACPPQDKDYLFCHKPPEQRIPTEDMLVGYYWDISQEARARGILLEEPETYASQYFKKGKLVTKIPVYHGSMVDSILTACEELGMDKEEVTEDLGKFLENGVGEHGGCKLASLMVGLLKDPGPDSDQESMELLEEPDSEPLFSELFDCWVTFRDNQYLMHANWGFSDYNGAKLTSQGIVARLHRDLRRLEKGT